MILGRLKQEERLSLGVWEQPGQHSKISLLSYLLASEPVPGAASAAFLPGLGLLIACHQGKGLSLSLPTWAAPMPELGWGRRRAWEEENTNSIRLGPIGKWLKTVQLRPNKTLDPGVLITV